ncbi:hypothetical protein [Flavihumibacter petaseus]|uniref:DUF4968 domain-containing protein n=1 Tax=Flavihumibacter petaseus NBRC 106054 TaxID=1220578 RepID=A0A0E9N722_9BACT|nr:hypothetical protein [Flavihumibacter petaseus]GAO45598.1 hypothetical protein FPE01S_06_00890 [Flavihumibacter petaseus NBRC 106054]
MKKLFQFCLLATFCLIQTLHAQNGGDPSTKGYLFSRFVPGFVKMKNGATQTVSLNYNMLEQSLIYLQDDQQMTITNPDEVEFVMINDAKFIAIKGKFYHQITETPVALLVTYTAKVDRMVPTADKAATEKRDQDVVSNTVSDTYVTKRYKQDFNYTPGKTYWLKNGQVLTKANTEKQVAAAFPKKSDEIRTYMKENKTDFSDVGSVEKVILFANE